RTICSCRSLSSSFATPSGISPGRRGGGAGCADERGGLFKKEALKRNRSAVQHSLGLPTFTSVQNFFFLAFVSAVLACLAPSSVGPSESSLAGGGAGVAESAGVAAASEAAAVPV